MDDNLVAEPVVAEPKPAVGRDRRRPGRVNYTEPALIELLRRPASGPSGEGAYDSGDRLAPARGIVFAIALAVPLWCALGAAIWLVVRWLS